MEALRKEWPLRWLRMWLISFCVWIPLSSYFGFVVYVWQRDSGAPTQLFPILEKHVILYAFAAVLSPLVYFLGRRFPLAQEKWVKHAALHFAACLLFAWASAVYRISVLPVKDVMSNIPSSQLALIWRFFVSYTMDLSIFVYWPIVGLAQIALFRQRSREREVRAVELQAQLAEAQLRALKMQVQPHFFFNTLHSISSLMHTDVHAADKMISRLSDLLRMSLESADTQECPLWQEMEFLDKYLQIEQIRFSDRLSVSIAIDPAAREAAVPTMILQPLVENAVRHGVSKRTAGGVIRVRASRENGWLHLAVEDNGPGFSPAQESSGGGLGLRNTRERLEKLYGAQQSFSVWKASEGGVEVRLRLPFARQMHASSSPAETAPVNRKD